MGAGRLKTGNESSLSAPASTELQGVSLRGIKSINKAKIFDGLANSFRGWKISFNILQFPSKLSEMEEKCNASHQLQQVGQYMPIHRAKVSAAWS